MTEQELNEQLLKVLRYPAIVYAQSYDGAEQNGKFVIDYPFAETPRNALLFVVPCKSSITRTTDTSDEGYNRKKNGNVLILKRIVRYRSNPNGVQEAVYSEDDQYFIMCEDPNGNLREAKKDDIVARRLAILRIEPGTKKRVNGKEYGVAILCNSPTYGTLLALSGLTVSNGATFTLHDGKAPSLILNPETGEKTYLARADEMAALEARIAKLETRIMYGTKDPETALRDAAEGTIYVRLPED